MGATLGPAIVGELLRHTVAKNAVLLSRNFTDFNPDISHTPVSALYGMLQQHALVVSMKEIYGWLLMTALFSLLILAVSYGPVRPWAIFPKWSVIRNILSK